METRHERRSNRSAGRHDGTKWSALYDENIQIGVRGFGDTLEEAMTAFDQAWWKENTPTRRLAERAAS